MICHRLVTGQRKAGPRSESNSLESEESKKMAIRDEMGPG